MRPYHKTAPMRKYRIIASDVPGVLVLHILDCTPSLDTADREASPVGKAADNPCLPLEGALQGLVELVGLDEVDDVDVAIGGAHDEQVVPHVHRVDALLAL